MFIPLFFWNITNVVQNVYNLATGHNILIRTQNLITITVIFNINELTLIKPNVDRMSHASHI